MSEHSPGPWKACRDGECRCGFIWAHVASAHGPEDLGRDYYGSDTACDQETQKANARLIAAAPDLLAAAIAAQEFMGDVLFDKEPEGGHPLRKQLADAIAKAEGR